MSSTQDNVSHADIEHFKKNFEKYSLKLLNKTYYKIVYTILLLGFVSWLTFSIWPSANTELKEFPLLHSLIGMPMFFFPFALIAFFILVLLDAAPKKAFAERYKRELVTQTIKSIDPEATYEPEGKMFNQVAFDHLKLYKRISRLSHSDYIHFKNSGCEYSETYASSKKKRVFRGSVYRIRFETPLQVPVRIVSEKGVKEVLSELFGAEHIKLDNPEFEKYYNVYCTDPIYARYVLTPKMMELLVAFQKMNDKELRMAFIDNYFYLLVVNDKDRFEPRYSFEKLRDDLNKTTQEFQEIIEQAKMIRLEWHHISINKPSSPDK